MFCFSCQTLNILHNSALMKIKISAPISVWLPLASWLLINSVFATEDINTAPCSSPLSPAIANSCIVTPDTLWRGAKPDVAGAAALINKGVKSVINLELLHDDRDAFLTAKPEISSNTFIAYYRIYEWEPNVVIAPSLLDKHVAEFISIMQTAAKPVYVHCRSGQNRTGVMVASWRVLVESMPVEDAIAEMQKYDGIWFKQDAAYLRDLASKRRDKVEKLIREYAAHITPLAKLECSKSGCLIAK